MTKLTLFHKIPTDKPSLPLLESLNNPHDLRALKQADLWPLANELREHLLYCAGISGGHFSPCLGATELTLALHYSFQTPTDALLFDVGHQAYPHKALTGRKDELDTIRSFGGLAPFLDPKESTYDVLKAGHAGTALGTALGMALADQRLGASREVVAVVGDGALTCGQTLEALNHAGSLANPPNLWLVLNDNQMSISPNISKLTPRTEAQNSASAKPAAMQNPVETLFQILGWHYVGPVDGHDIDQMIAQIEALKGTTGPKVLHVKTLKGKGFAAAEDDPVAFHALNKISPLREQVKKPAPGPTYSQTFGQTMIELADKEPRLCAITPAMAQGSGLAGFAKRFPDRFFDVGIAEQHALTLAAGLATGGMLPVVSIYSTFLQRGYDQLIHDLAVGEHQVTLAVDRAGLVGEDGPTHHGMFDISFLRCVPDLWLAAPSSPQMTAEMLSMAIPRSGLKAIRFPRGAEEALKLDSKAPEEVSLTWGKGALVYAPKDASGVILSVGNMLSTAMSVATELGMAVADLRFIKPLDGTLLRDLLRYPHWVTLEDHTLAGGAGSAVAQWLVDQEEIHPLINLGLPDEFVPHGSVASLRHNLLTPQSIKHRIQSWLANHR